jgi:hypothetical protein
VSFRNGPKKPKHRLRMARPEAVVAFRSAELILLEFLVCLSKLGGDVGAAQKANSKKGGLMRRCLDADWINLVSLPLTPLGYNQKVKSAGPETSPGDSRRI